MDWYSSGSSSSSSSGVPNFIVIRSFSLRYTDITFFILAAVCHLNEVALKQVFQANCLSQWINSKASTKQIKTSFSSHKAGSEIKQLRVIR